MKPVTETLRVSFQHEARGPEVVLTWRGQKLVLPAQVAAQAAELIEQALEIPRAMGQIK